MKILIVEDEKKIIIREIINERVELVDELITLENISIQLSVETPFKANMNPYLAETLISNLLGNAIKHNFENGQIHIKSEKNRLTISNSGNALGIEPSKIFQRFVKHTTTNESNGLGLAIVSEICRNYNLVINYDYQNGMHHFILTYAK